MDNKKIDVSQDFKDAGFVYREIDEENMSDSLKKKYELAKKLCNNTIDVQKYDSKNSR